MKVLRTLTLAAIFAAAAAMTCAAQEFKITEGEYYRNGGVDVMAFDDLYPEGHQGGVVSGTGLVRPDFPELLEFPYIWQQAEYQIGGACNNYKFLVLAADSLLEKE